MNNVLCVFDGIKYDKYYASEIDKYAIKVTQSHVLGIIQLGDIRNIKVADLPPIDLLIGGSPCQGFSFSGKGLNFDDPRSKLFFEFVRLKNELNPKYFLLENVVMKQEYQDVISENLGVKPIKINSSLKSAQNRPRLYWTNIPNIEQPEDKNITLADILEDNVDLKYKLSEAKIKRVLETQRGKGFFYNKTHNKCGTLISGYHKQPTDGVYIDLGFKRRLTPTEFEKLQTVPLNYTACLSDTQRYKTLGNGWTIDVIAHIFKNIE